MKAKLFILFSLLLLTGIAVSQTINTAKLDSLMLSLEKHNKAMGCLTISLDGKEIYSKATGIAETSDKGNVPATVSTRYRIGSISKTFTAVLALKLMEEKMLKGNALLKDYFPAVKNSDKITIDMMLAHRSGIFSLTDDSTYTEWMTNQKSKEELLKLIASYPSVFAPDSKASYSNSNYVLLGYIIEKVTGKSYDEVLKEKITGPADLKNTYYGSVTDPSKGESFSYSFEKSWKKEPETNMSIPHGAGAIVSTSADVVKFFNALFNYKLISKESVDRMSAITENYGMGLFQFPFGDKIAFGHTGGIDGFVSNAAYFPNEKLSFAFLSNGMNYNMNTIIIGILSICFNQPFELPEFGETYTIKEEDLNRYPGVYSTSAMPIKLTISIRDGAVTAQGTGQPAFELEPVRQHHFKFDRAGLKIEFHPERNELTLLQGGGTFLFVKE